MTPSAYTEDTLVQQTTAEYLEQKLGWESVYAYNNEDFGPDSLLGRELDREVVLTRTLRAKIEELNPVLPATAYEDTIRQIVTVSATQTMAATNREKYELIKDGVQVTFRNAKGERERERRRLWVFDFDNPENNRFPLQKTTKARSIDRAFFYLFSSCYSPASRSSGLHSPLEFPASSQVEISRCPNCAQIVPWAGAIA